VSGSQILDAVVSSPVGRLGIQMQDKALSGLIFLSGRQQLVAPEKGRAGDVLRALQAYFDDPRRLPDVDLQLSGTPFQCRVWQELCSIPVGKIITYGALARRLESSARAVGNACRRNPVPILVPCHRVVAARGLGGFAGSRRGRLIGVKRWLLKHEGVEI
jgi:methylated-DNA-[protein]-cysteine S-methyltransferase